MKEQYVILTGSKNNAGDYLIKYRSKILFSRLRPDREIIDLNGWNNLSINDLDLINNSKALILTGGPALVKEMYPRVYGLREDLSEIKVPIISMGIGWHSIVGEWRNTHNYKISKGTSQLLKKIGESGYLSSVRDYHSLNVLHNFGINNVLMTGCPALYDASYISNKIDRPRKIKRIGYSIGVSMVRSKKMKIQMRNTIKLLRGMFPDTEIIAVFHHSIASSYLSTEGASRKVYKTHIDFKDWLEREGFPYIDISGSADNLMKFYSSCDLHVGYRVHAHIFMNSISKLSLLIAEDGRGKALEKVIGGIIIPAYQSVSEKLLIKALHRCGLSYDNYSPSNGLLNDIKNILIYELKHGIKLYQPRVEIDRHYLVMRRFLEQLP